MLIILNIKPQIPCAEIYAKPDFADFENGESYAVVNGTTYITAKFWHNAQRESLESTVLPDFCDNDEFLAFHSDVPFAEFCQVMSTSEFNDPKTYQLLTHNCAYGAAHALKVAGIQLDVPQWQMFNRVGYRFYEYMPAFSFTPMDLLVIAKKHHSRILEKSNIKLKLSLATSSLLFKCHKQHDPEKKAIGLQILHGCQMNMKKNPEHAYTHLQTLLLTAELIAGDATPEELFVYHSQSRYYYHRQQQRFPGTPYAASLHIMMLGILNLTIFAGLEALGIRSNNAIACVNAIACGNMLAAASLVYATMSSSSMFTHPPRVATELSESMRKLAL